MQRVKSGFTLIELMIVIVIIGILAGITILSYGAWQREVDDKAVQNDVSHATSSLLGYKNFKNSYPPNLAGANFAASPNVGLVLYTDAPSIGVYTGLTADQNAQLLLNVCNANLVGYNTACTFAGSGGGAKIHVKGTNSTNLMWTSPVTQSTITGTLGALGSPYSTAANTIISQFLAQGGTFPVYLSGNSVSLPTPTQTPNGPAQNFCLQGISGNYPDIVYYTTNTNPYVTAGPCPNNPSLHYYPN